MDKNKKRLLKEHTIGLMTFMEEEGFTEKPFPRVRYNDEVQKVDELKKRTGYYDPDECAVTVFTERRAVKDILRSLAHELIHHKQNMDGRLGDGAYSGDKITEDSKLIKLEEEAYKKGNIAFRRYTEFL